MERDGGENMASDRLRTIMIYELLSKYSDEEHPLTAVKMIEMLAEKGIVCGRKALYADLRALNEFGCDIVRVNYPVIAYFLAGRSFELPEVRLLIDAVSSAGFITPNKTQSLVQKLETLLSVHQARSLVSQVYCKNETKCDNEEIYYVIDTLHEAITKGVKVKFTYKKRNIDKACRKNYTEKTFQVSPYALIWKNDHYYLVCNHEKYENLMNLRLDRMRRIRLLDEAARDFSEVSDYSGRFDSADYSAKMFHMFSGETEPVRLLCRLELREEIMDRFGSAVPLKAVDFDHFETTVCAAVSDGLVSWIMQYGDSLKVLEPQYLAQRIQKKARQIARLYPDP